mmetsp:Transcript_26503/g.57621  ORF Transcript_26503/g.57621 Transcript_26503/m.57621 type:complete len:1296 (-) Transcript_26503:240-4127(-)|eukprot:CAMPEP_0118936612 /NCGR_PEP_ID=MMETSP1169-20130426/19636_1 /TAXON_ID=36882 /ORGANISM="Pyramimonas obovata, Strain CCMP722" /LENGTH=1295 /DNA_ID=CAMNT_0006879921 /DNA_START=403 /DNA_END=4287 /DNA_ORIENTATION=+
MFRGRLFRFGGWNKARDDRPSKSAAGLEDGRSSRNSSTRSLSTPTRTSSTSSTKAFSISDVYNAFKSGGGGLELKDFAVRLKISPSNIWLRNFGSLCDRHNGTHIGFIELVHICGSIGQKYEDPEAAASYFLWRLLDVEDSGRLSRVEASRRLQAVYSGTKSGEDARFVLEQSLPTTVVDEGAYRTVTRNLPEHFVDAFAIWNALQNILTPSKYILMHLYENLGPKASEMGKVLHSNRMKLDIMEVAALRDLLQDKKNPPGSPLGHTSSSSSKDARGVQSSMSTRGVPLDPEGAKGMSSVSSFMLQEIMHAYDMRVQENLGARDPLQDADDDLLNRPPLQARPNQPLYASNFGSVMSSSPTHGNGSPKAAHPFERQSTLERASSSNSERRRASPSEPRRPSLLQSFKGSFKGSLKGSFRSKPESPTCRPKRPGMHGSRFEASSSSSDLMPNFPKSRATRNLILKAFKGCMLFDDMDPEVVDQLIDTMEMRTEDPGVDVITQGDTDSSHLFVVECGHCAVYFTDKNGNAKRVNEKGPGTRFGDLALMYDSARSATVRVEQTATLWTLQRKVYNRVNVLHAERVQQRKEELVANVPIFRMLDPPSRRTIVEALIPVTFKAGTKIITQGEVGDTFYIVDKGLVSVTMGDRELAKLGPDSSFGETALIKNEVRAANVTSVVETNALMLQRENMLAVFGPLEEGKRYCLLRKVPAMTFLDDGKLHKIMKCIKTVDVKPGEYLQVAGQHADATFIVESGEVVLIDARAKRNMQRLRRGSFWRNTGEVGRKKAGEVFGDEVFAGATTRQLTAYCSDAGPAKVLKLRNVDVMHEVGSLKELAASWRMTILNQVPVLRMLDERSLTTICDAMEVQQYEDGHILAEEGDVEMRFHLVQFGMVDCSSGGQSTRRLKAGSYFGEMGILGKESTERYTSIGASVVASVPADVMCQFEDLLRSIMMEMRVNSLGAPTQPARKNLLKLKHLNGVRKVKLVGVGGYGMVYLVRAEGNVYAMKVLLKDHIMQSKMAAQVNEEREIGLECDTPFMVNLCGTFRDSKFLYMFMEPVMGGELFSYVERKRLSNRGIPEKDARFYAGCIVLAIEYLHKLGVVYRDLKLENLLIDKDGYCKVADLGFAKRVDDGKTYTVCGTPEYMAPEVIARKGHGTGVDVWAIGVVIYELVTRWTPFSKVGDDMAIMNKIKKGEYSFPSYMSRELVDLITRMLQVNLAQRLGCQRGGLNDVKAHPWFKGFDWQLLERRKMKPPWIPPLNSIEDASNMDPVDQATPLPGARASNMRRPSNGIFDHW